MTQNGVGQPAEPPPLQRIPNAEAPAPIYPPRDSTPAPGSPGDLNLQLSPTVQGIRKKRFTALTIDTSSTFFERELNIAGTSIIIFPDLTVFPGGAIGYGYFRFDDAGCGQIPIPAAPLDSGGNIIQIPLLHIGRFPFSRLLLTQYVAQFQTGYRIGVFGGETAGDYVSI